MKILVKTLQKEQFDIEVTPTDSIIAVKKQIEDLRGKDFFPANQLLLLHQGKLLEEGTTLEENMVFEHSFIVVMLKRRLAESSSAPTLDTAGASAPTPSPPTATHAPASFARRRMTLRTRPSPPTTGAAGPPRPPPPTPVTRTCASPPATSPPTTAAAGPPLPTPPTPAVVNPAVPSAQTASNVVPVDSSEKIIQNIMDIGGGNWARESVCNALRAAVNNPEQAIEYLSSSTPEAAEVGAPPLLAAVPSHGAERSRASSQGQQLSADWEALERLAAMGFPRNRVTEAFLACDKDEQLAANFLLEDAGD